MGKEEFLKFATENGFSAEDIRQVVADVESRAGEDSPADWEYGRSLLFFDPRIAHYKMSKKEFMAKAKQLGYSTDQINGAIKSVETYRLAWGMPPAWEAQLIVLPEARTNLIGRPARNLSDAERQENADIL